MKISLWKRTIALRLVFTIGGEALDLDQVVVLQVDLLVLKKYTGTGDYHDYVKIFIISSQV